MRSRSWKDDLPPVILAIAGQFVILRVVSWARAEPASNELAQKLVANQFYFAPQIVVLVILALLVRLVRHALDLRGLGLFEWIRSSIIFLILGCAVLIATHADQILSLLASVYPAEMLAGGVRAIHSTSVYGALGESPTIRWALDLLGLLTCLLGFRFSSFETPQSGSTRDPGRSGDWAKAGELHLKQGNVKKAIAAFRKGNLPLRVAPLELREGRPRVAAEIYEQAGDAFAWEAARAWEAAGDKQLSDAARERAIAESRANSRWDRLSEIAETTGDQPAQAEASRRLAELRPAGPARNGLLKRAAEASKASGKFLDAAECYRAASEFLLAAELYLQARLPAEAARDFERGGDLGRAAKAASDAGEVGTSRELSARDAEQRGEFVVAAEAWSAAGIHDRAAGLFEKKSLFRQAAESWRAAGRHDQAASLFIKAGQKGEAAVSYEAAGQPEKAAVLYRELRQFDKSAELFRAVGKMPEAADSLQSAGRFEEAAVFFQRSGKGLSAARCMLSAGHREKAWEHLTTVPRTEPGLREFFLELAEAHLKVGEPKDAVHVLRHLLGPSSVDARTLAANACLVRALEASGERDEAAVRLARIVEFDPQFRIAERATQLSGAQADLAVPEALVEDAGNPIEVEIFPPTMTPFPAAAFALPTLASWGSSASRPPSGVIPTVAPLLPVTSSGSYPNINQPEIRYELLSEIGRGGMGVVHKALDRKLDRHVALKILPWQLQSDETAKRYFEREAKAIATLKHPNIVALYDYGEGFGSLYLAMEFLDGPNLQSLLKSDPERVKRSWRNWFVQATRGVAAAHAKGLLHRDLKPANLMLDEHGTLRILDFGLARPEADSGATSKLIGTPAFFPPEVLRGEMPTPSSDVYSLGATFYTLATGRWPYVGDDVLIARLEREPDDPRPFAPQLSEDEVVILMRSLARHRPDRYPDAGELLGDLLSLEG